MKPVVFAGPSLGRGDAEAYPELEFRPPARKGDLLVAALDGARVLGLVDGFFETQPSVWHKEILFCLSRGILVAGAASMGALRAAECAAYGMIGIGRIFEDYHSGKRMADSDVAVLHAPAELGHAALTLALVDAEETVQHMLGEGVLSQAEAEAALAIARDLHFQDRTWRAILERMSSLPVDHERLRRELSRFRIDRKQEDCRKLLDFLRDLQEAPVAPRFELQNSAFLDNLLRQVATGEQEHP